MLYSYGVQYVSKSYVKRQRVKFGLSYIITRLQVNQPKLRKISILIINSNLLLPLV